MKGTASKQPPQNIDNPPETEACFFKWRFAMIQLATKHDDPDLKLGWGERIGFGMASCGRSMLSGVLGSFIMIYRGYGFGTETV